MSELAPKIVFRADASLQIGSGHVMRCLTLADELGRKGVECHFICGPLPDTLEKMITGRGHRLHKLRSAMKTAPDNDACDGQPGLDWETDAGQSSAILEKILPDWLAVDHYALDARWEQAVSRYCARLFVIDDLADRAHHCDLLLDQTYERKPSVYRSLVPPHCRILTGTAYALLRPGFAHLREYGVLDNIDRGRGGHLLITMGGADKDNVTGAVLDALRRRSAFPIDRITVVLGAASPWQEKVREQAAALPYNVSVKVNVTDMAAEMAAADYAVGAAGATSWERCCLGVPAVILVLAPNQQEVAAALTRTRAAELAKADEPDLLWQALARINGDLAGYRRRCLQVCDGRGVFRVMQHLTTEKSVPGGIWLRPADPDDIRRVFDWQCLPETRRYARKPEPPAWQEHQSWMQQRLQDIESHFYIIQSGDDPAGVVRLARAGRGCYEVSIYLDPGAYGKGIARRALRALAEIHGDIDILATVLEGNEASHRLFSAAGFKKIDGQTYILKRAGT